MPQQHKQRFTDAQPWLQKKQVGMNMDENRMQWFENPFQPIFK